MKYHLFGDSHIECINNKNLIKHQFTACSSMGLNNPKSISGSQKKILSIYSKISKDDLVMMKFGQVDTEFVYYIKLTNKHLSFEEFAIDSVNKYFEFILNNLNLNNLIILSIFPPFCDDANVKKVIPRLHFIKGQFKEELKKKLSLINIPNIYERCKFNSFYNSLLKKKCNEFNIKFVDLYSVLVNKNNHPLYLNNIPNHHLHAHPRDANGVVVRDRPGYIKVNNVMALLINEFETNKIIKLQKLLKTNKRENDFWEEIQKQTDRNLRVISPPLNSLVYEVCHKLLVKQHIIWIGGPPGVGKTSCSKRFQDYGFMAMDCEDPWNKNKCGGCHNCHCRLTGLTKITEKVYNELNTSFVFGACHGKYLPKAPEYVHTVLILPDKQVYEKRWKKRGEMENKYKNDGQNYNGRYKLCQEIAKKYKDNILILHQPIEECIDVTIYRICQLIINKIN